MGWECLPFELHRKILQILIHDELESKLVAEYAVVCRSWQAQVEEINFQKLAVNQDDLTLLEQIVTGPRQTYLRHIRLNVELPKYTNSLRYVPENEHEQETNNFRFTVALFETFELLALWDTPDFWAARNGRGLDLELCAYSPSDKKHRLGERSVDADGNSRFLDSLLDFHLLALEEPDGPHGLPLVNVVTGLFVLRRSYRNISAAALTPVIRSLPNLQELRLESWMQIESRMQEDVDSGLYPRPPLPRAAHALLKRTLLLFEHFGAWAAMITPGVNRTRHSYPYVSQQIRQFSTEVEEMSCSFIVDAVVFFEQFSRAGRNLQLPSLRLKPPYWPNLRWLTLTCYGFCHATDPDRINDVLFSAAKGAKNMPKLLHMEIYNVNQHCAAVFRYLVIKNTALISWTSTFDFKLDGTVKTLWKQVGHQSTRKEPIVFGEVRMANYGTIRQEGFIHSELATRELVLHRESSTDLMEGRPFPDSVLPLQNLPPIVLPSTET
ncbi:hypothetical protein M406DRAFT_246615 [Cryphonectria parasitica EP155]|uniref:DUF6546 domain-containing protein n=1 Tax=Cryphonectria parasitica (strain ATCC 38755 / EP155) TaxID=660469 RepID=A0A9P5CVM2_CRYP1|nr:uncharacterized protein M406DRAFT_246615 [Cryphonectria parasitica EP155]KAF3771201.1 hypothetical protein M406DRAFT_246615 [Cryphonectria parasitica EP155]